ncbi:MAG: hypothetical protein BroJett038_33000 [Chloroflexota bacterium]|nr:MAG: hypothetical protein BroJett038_33000 [Chloroflexota bacterium]
MMTTPCSSGPLAPWFWRLSLLLLLAAPALLWADATPRKDFDLAAGDAADTLPQYVRQSGEEVVYLVDRVRGVRTNPVRGTLSASEALQAMLEGTELRQVRDERSGAITIQRVRGANPEPEQRTAPTSDQVVVLSAFEIVEDRVRGYQATNTTSATRLNTPIVDLSKNISVITRDLIDDMQVTEFNEALYLSSSVSYTSPYSGRVAIRGFENAAPKRNGLGNYGSDESITDTATMERIEVVKGPSSLLYGSSSPGGLVNYVTKKPVSYRINNLRLMVGSNQKLRTELDLGGTVFERKDLTYRFVAAHETSDGPGLYNLSERGVVAGSMRWHFGPKTYLMVGGEYMSSKRTLPRPYGDGYHMARFGPSGIFDGDYVFNTAKLINKFQRDDGVHAGAGPRNHHDTFVTRYDVDFSHTFANDLNVFVNYNWMQNKLQEINTNGQNEGWVTRPVDPPSYNEQAMPLGFRWPNRIQHNLTAALNYTIKRDSFETQIVAGMEFYKFDLEFANYSMADSSLWPKVNFVTLAGYATQNWANTPRSILQNIADTNGTQWQQHFYYTRQQTYDAPYLLFHNYLLDRRLRVLAGIRRDKINIQQLFYPMDPAKRPFGLLPPTPTDSDASATTPLLGLSFTPLKDQPGFTIYSSFSRSLLANEIVNPDGSSLPPETGEGLEVGLKFDITRRFSGTLSWFHIEKQNLARLVLNSNPAFWETTGLQRSKGVDLDVFYAITPDWQVLFSGVVLDTTYVSDDNPAYIGQRLPGVPKWSYSLWSKYTFSSGSLSGFSFGGGLVSKPEILPWGQQAPNLKNPAYERIDLLFGYSTKIGGKECEFGVKINNLTDKLFFDGLAWGPARSYLLTASVHF